MHKKSPRGIPDFARHAPAPTGAHVPAPEGKRQAAPPPPAAKPTVKPQATHAKAGRRGQ